MVGIEKQYVVLQQLNHIAILKKRSKVEGTSSCEAVDVSQYTISDLETDESDSDTET